MPRYVLLLQDLFKHTPEGHADRELLQEALKAVKGVASEIEAEMAAQENRLKCLAIQVEFLSLLLLLFPSSPSLSGPLRLLSVRGGGASSLRARGRPHQAVPQGAQAAPLLPLLRPPHLRAGARRRPHPPPLRHPPPAPGPSPLLLSLSLLTQPQVRVQELPPGGDALGFNILAPGKSFAVYGATPQVPLLS